MVVCLFKFGKLSTVKHTVASVGLISFQQLSIYLQGIVHVRYLTCILSITIHRLRPRADNICATNVCDFVLLAKFAKLIVRKHFYFYSSPHARKYKPVLHYTGSLKYDNNKTFYL